MAAVVATFHTKRNDHFTFIVANDHVITCNYATDYSSQNSRFTNSSMVNLDSD